MTGYVWATAVNGAPAYGGKALRLLASAFGLKGTDRPVGGRSGVTAGTPASVLSVTSAAWTVQPITGFIDVSAASDGGTPFAFDQAVTGAVNAADASNPRVDLLVLRHDDPSEGDGSGAPLVAVQYVAGVAAAAPVAPVLPARTIQLARINVPKLNNGAPTITLTAPFTTAAGGIVPARASTEYPPNPYVGQWVDDAVLGLVRWDGTGWSRPPGTLIAEVQSNANPAASGSTVGVPGPSNGAVNFTLTSKTRVKIEADMPLRLTAAPAAGSQYNAWCAINPSNGTLNQTVSGAQQVGNTAQLVASTIGYYSMSPKGTVLLNPGTYTAFTIWTRFSGGSNTDSIITPYIAVYAAGAS